MSDAEKQARDLFAQFQALHPNSKEQFVFNLENIQRWNWHIKEASARPEPDEVEVQGPSPSAERLAKTRSFSNFTQLPAYMQSRFLLIASAVPGLQFYATGSRINGGYIETWSGAGIKKLRQQLNLPEKEESDYDVAVDILPGYPLSLQQIREQVGNLGDVVTGVPPGQKIVIPMWDFSRLPESEYDRVLDLFAAKNWGELMKVHNTYALSMNVYCCDEKPIIRYFTWAIEEAKIIARKNEQQKETTNLD